MHGSKKHRSEAGALTRVDQSADTEATILTLSNVERFAAEQRAIAEDELYKARDFEEQVAKERRALAELVSVSDAAIAAEREAVALLEAARQMLGAASSAEMQACSAVEEGLRGLDERRDARMRAEADVAQMRAGIELLSARSGMSVEAARRAVERRIADRFRERAKLGAT